MTNYSYLYDIVTTSPNANAINLVSADLAYIGQGVSVSSSNGNGLAGTDHNRVIIGGDLFGTTGARFYTPGGQNFVLINSGASVSGVSGVQFDGAGDKLVNAGTISGNSGVFMGDGARLVNTGLIQGVAVAVSFSGSQSLLNKLTNTGQITSLDVALSATSDSSVQHIVNRGLIAGDIDLGFGDDRLDSRGGVIEGQVILGGGNDTMLGSMSGDYVDGWAGNDVIRGREGDDTLDGSFGKDKLAGGTGEDEFRFSATPGVAHADTIADFTHGEDMIALDMSIFAALGPTITASEFVSNASGHGASKNTHHLIYDRKDGSLWFDGDGKGGATALKFAQLGTVDNHPLDLTFADFAIA